MECQSPTPAAPVPVPAAPPAAPRRSSARLRAPPAPSPRTTPQVSAVASAAAAAARRARYLERLREVEEPAREVRRKVRQLAGAVRSARHLVVYTGAGISTAARIPDYRGPRGLWTALRHGRPRPRVDVAAARPTFTHMALAALWRCGRVRFVVSQNCDGLHMRAGLPRRALAELHGDMFVEHCVSCRARYLRAFDTTEQTARSRHRTGRLCLRCGAELRDSIVHFGERGRARWPLNWAGALRHAARADVVLCLGSSLKVLRRYPRLWGVPRRRPRLYIVNLQWTPKDAAAELKISARCDVVMRELMRLLRVRVPRYRARRDPLFAHRTPLSPLESHTTRRQPLRVSDLTDDDASDVSSRTTSRASPSSADSDDDRPLCVVAHRLRAADRPRPEDETALRSFSVPLRCGEATILMRARHAPAATPVSGLRLYRKPTHLNGAPVPTTPTTQTTPTMLAHHTEEKPIFPDGFKTERSNGKLEFLEEINFSPKKNISCSDEETKQFEKIDKIEKNEYSIKKCELSDSEIKFSDEKMELSNNGMEFTNKKMLMTNGDADDDKDRKLVLERTEVPEGPAGEDGQAGDVMRECVSLARAIIAHAVVVCRAQLYPGLHNIISPEAAPSAAASPPPAPPAPAQRARCAWCLAHYSSPHCQFYLPRDPCSPGRPARTVDGRRYLCACCPARSGSRPGGSAVDTDGWYGAGCRRPRRRR